MSNGLSIVDLGLDDNDFQDLAQVLSTIELNKLTKQEVKAAYDTFAATKNDPAGVKTKLKELAAFIYANGIHEQLKGTLAIGNGITWTNLKAYFDFRSSKKQMLVRWTVPIICKIHAIRNSENKSLLRRQAEKWNLDTEYNNIPEKFRFFGAYFHPETNASDRQAILEFQRSVIQMSQGGVNRI